MMMGVSLTRWTMLYFATALVALILAEGLMVAGYGYPGTGLRAPETLVVVHLVTVGWLSFLMCGAMFQFVPVLVARPLYSEGLPLLAYLLLASGLGLLIAGFLQLAGTISLPRLLLPYAAILLAAGFLILVYNLGRTMWAARPLPLPARFVAVSLVSLLATVALGAVFSFGFAGLLSSDAMRAIAGDGLSLHIIAGLGGWLTFAAMGVSYRLLAMFMLAPELDGRRPRTAFWAGAFALVAAIVCGVIALLVPAIPYFDPMLLALVLGIVSLGAYGADVVHLYRARKRPIIELNSRMAGFAVASLGFSILLGLVLMALGQFAAHGAALVFLIAFGWLSGLGLAKLYKITAFLTWLECYGPVLGKQPTPRVQDLVSEPRARKWFYLYYLAVWAATIMLLADNSMLFRVMAVAMIIATLAIASELLRTRRLADVPEKLRLSETVSQPRLLVCLPVS